MSGPLLATYPVAYGWNNRQQLSNFGSLSFNATSAVLAALCAGAALVAADGEAEEGGEALVVSLGGVEGVALTVGGG